MINTVQIKNLPENVCEYVDEIGTALGDLYGAAAETAYRIGAKASYSRLIRHPDVMVWGCDRNETPGLVICVVRRGIGHITLLHVLKKRDGEGIEGALLDAVTLDLRRRGVRAIIGEFVRYRPLDLEDTLLKLGYLKFDRQLMIADLGDPRLATEGAVSSSACGERDELAADVLVDAYCDHPSRILHPEAHDDSSAIGFLESFRAGGFGATRDSLYRICQSGDRCEGMIAGAEAAPDVGFILHVATTRRVRGSGMGTRLIRELADALRVAGYRRVGLGVTRGNPAERLYARLGFEHLLPVETYVWWATPNSGEEPR